MIWLADHQQRELKADRTRGPRWRPDEVTLILAVPSINKALRDELEALKLSLPESDTGYHSVAGALLPLLVTDLGVVATEQWVWQHFQKGTDVSLNATPDLYGYEEFVARYLASLTPEQRLKGIAESELVLALPDHALRALSEEYIATLPPDVQATVRARRAGR